MSVETTSRQSEKSAPELSYESFEYTFARDVASSLVADYAELVRQVTRSHMEPLAAEFAYERLLGVRGSLCRICPSSFMKLLDEKTLEKWKSAENLLSNHVNLLKKDNALYDVAKRVEERWTSNVEAFLRGMAVRALAGELMDQIGLLRGIDSIALHLAQRELFRWSEHFSVSSGNAHALKLRIRLLSLFLATQRQDFGASFQAIKSYRETFGISDRQAYPWWFVDCDLTERQMNWTYRRLNCESLGWRFQDS